MVFGHVEVARAPNWVNLGPQRAYVLKHIAWAKSISLSFVGVRRPFTFASIALPALAFLLYALCLAIGLWMQKPKSCGAHTLREVMRSSCRFSETRVHWVVLRLALCRPCSVGIRGTEADSFRAS